MRKRIIPCLDVRDGRVVKGKKFQNVQDVANPIDLAKQYENDQADCLFLLDIGGQNRTDFLQVVKDIASQTTFPLYVGGGIRSIEDIGEVINSGAKKVSITSAAIDQPSFLKEAVDIFGGERIILSIDAKQITPHTWHAFTQGGNQDAGLDAIEWSKQGAAFGVSEILLNSIDADGIKKGYDLSLNKAVSSAVNIPVIASGGAGELHHFRDVLNEGKASAALAASVFHYNEIQITDLKEYLLNFDIAVEEI